MRMPGTLLTIWFVSPWPMNPAPIMPTRIGLPSCSRAFSARSTMIMTASARTRCRLRASCAHPAFQLFFDLVEPPPRPILRRDLGHGQRPREAETGVVVGKTAFAIGRVELTHVVTRLGPVLERLVTVRE